MIMMRRKNFGAFPEMIFIDTFKEKILSDDDPPDDWEAREGPIW